MKIKEIERIRVNHEVAERGRRNGGGGEEGEVSLELNHRLE